MVQMSSLSKKVYIEKFFSHYCFLITLTLHFLRNYLYWHLVSFQSLFLEVQLNMNICPKCFFLIQKRTHYIYT